MSEPKDIYDLFDQFIETTVVNRKNFFENTNDNIFDNNVLLSLVDICKNLSTKEKVKIEDINSEIEKSTNENIKKVYAHILWLQNLPVKDVSIKSKIDSIEKVTKLKTVYKHKGLVPYGRSKASLVEEIIDLILLFYNLINQNITNTNDVKANIIAWCLNLSEIRSETTNKTIDRDCSDYLLASHNMLLHLCKKEYYDDISATNHKERIVKNFNELLPDDWENKLPDDFEDDDRMLNKQYLAILNELLLLESETDSNQTQYKNLVEIGDNNISVYDDKHKYLWFTGSDTDDSEINILKFKKALVLYGPPGTSKTFSAKLLAKNLIFQKDYKGKASNPAELKKKVKEFLVKTDEDFKPQIHRLQLHPNYAYEDFIWGYQIENKVYKDKSKNIVCVGNQTVAKKGYFLRLIDKISKENEKKAHVLILDEINRVDLSRLFGELFSAIENRNESIDLQAKVEDSSEISIPENLYIIGTMNEIDFSLERVDFALRRRFAWFLYGYDENRLTDILENKLKKNNIPKLNDKDLLVQYVEHCTALNEMIDNDLELGPQYEIGHTFFSELVDIWKDMPNKGIKSIQEILWNISISPMIKAYLGNCDEKDKIDNRIEQFKKAFLVDKDKE